MILLGPFYSNLLLLNETLVIYDQKTLRVFRIIDLTYKDQMNIAKLLILKEIQMERQAAWLLILCKKDTCQHNRTL